MNKIAIFSHYDVDGIGDEYLEDILAHLIVSVDKIVIVTTSGFVSSSSFCTNEKIEIITRDNTGYDFLSYKVGIDSIDDLGAVTQLILLNDSFYINSIFDLEGILEKSKGKDVFGITASNQISFHIQSYFLVFNERAIKSKFFYLFWNRVYSYKNKMKIVLDYEIGLTKFAIKHNLIVDVFVKFMHDKNPCHCNCLELLRAVGILKIDVIRNDICKVELDEYFSKPQIFNKHIKRTKKFYRNKELKNGGQVKVGCNFFEYTYGNSNATSAVILHLFYLDLAEEIKSFLSKIPFDIDLYVTIADESGLSFVINTFSGCVSKLSIAVVENKGRDVKPFIDVLSAADFLQYELVLKLHSKKSKYSDFGAIWRNELYSGLIPSSSAINILKSIFVSHNIGIASSFISYLSSPDYWGANECRFCYYCDKLGLGNARDLFFVAGNMFWFSPRAIYPLVNLLKEETFEEECGQQDGTLAHVFERLVCMSAMSVSMEVVDLLNPTHGLVPIDVEKNRLKILDA